MPLNQVDPVKTISRPEAYLVDMNTRRWIPDPATLISLASIVILGAAALSGCGGGDPDVELDSANPSQDQATDSRKAPEGYVLQGTRWASNRIPVCWENGSAATATEQGWVRDRVKATWDAASAVSFTGWGNCSLLPLPGIRIRIADVNPATLGLGQQLSGIPNGMLLNFTFAAWNPSCAASSVRKLCIETIAIHEFGHALGLAHEQNRPDTDRSTCTELPQGGNGDVLIGAWDRNSVMNYCFGSSYGNALSPTDRATINSFYPREVVDFDGDGRSDVALLAGPGWDTIPVAFSLGAGTFNVTNKYAGALSAWAGTSHATVVTGDFDNDGLTDIAVVGGAGWNSIPLAFSLGDGTFRQTNLIVGGAFASLAAGPGARVISGDFNGDGRADIALIGGNGWRGIPVALSNGDGTFSVSNLDLGASFGLSASAGGVQTIVADFDGDGRTDVALMGGNLTSISIAYANSDGSFSVSNAAVPSLAYWASQPGAQVHAGDFNADGRADLVVTGLPGGQVPVALSLGRATFAVNTNTLPDFSAWSRVDGAKVVAADFNGDGRTDLALTGGQTWKTIPLLTSQGDGSFQSSNRSATGFGDWSSVTEATLFVGDFDRNRAFDLALIGGLGWNSMPVSLTSAAGYSVVNAPVGGSFALYASTPGVKIVAQRN